MNDDTTYDPQPAVPPPAEPGPADPAPYPYPTVQADAFAVAHDQLPIGELRARVTEHVTTVLGVPAELVDAAWLGGCQYPSLVFLGALLRETVTRRFRLLNRAATGADSLAAQAISYRGNADQGRVPWPMSGDALTVLSKLDGQLCELDDLLPKMAGALVDTAVSLGVCERPNRERVPA